MKSVKIITHRGIEDSDRPRRHKESTLQAFASHLANFDGIEFDLQVLSDDSVVVIHDANLSRVSSGKDTRLVSELTYPEFEKLSTGDATYADFERVLDLIAAANGTHNALHLKGGLQENPRALSLIFKILGRHKNVFEKCILFDILPETAAKIKSEFSNLRLAPSVAHRYDVLRFNRYVKKTLLTIEEAIEHSRLYQAVWLDEWDLNDQNDAKKKFYTEEVFDVFRELHLDIYLVTPELHATSPGLLASENHEDAKTKETLMGRIMEILSLGPTGICTDWPFEIKKRLTAA